MAQGPGRHSNRVSHLGLARLIEQRVIAGTLIRHAKDILNKTGLPQFQEHGNLPVAASTDT